MYKVFAVYIIDQRFFLANGELLNEAKEKVLGGRPIFDVCDAVAGRIFRFLNGVSIVF